MKKYGKKFLEIGELGIVGGAISSIDIGDNPQRGFIQGFSGQLPLAGTLLGTGIVLEQANELKKYSKRKKNDLF